LEVGYMTIMKSCNNSVQSCNNLLQVLMSSFAIGFRD
jgi:hypothetical protein